MRPNAILILSNVLSNINETYKSEPNSVIKLNHRDNHDDYEILVDEGMFKIVFAALSALEINTLNFYVKDRKTFVIF